jgi:uncharacterized membrane protein (DUF4010 family)
VEQLELFERLAVALVIGVLIGVERGWQERTAPEGSRIAGIRTFAIVGLLGGLWAVLAEQVGAVVLGFAFLAFALVMVIARWHAARETKDYGATTVVASMLTFVLGALAVTGEMEVAAAGAVVTALLLSIKSLVHGWVARLEQDELLAVLKLLAMTLVLLPVLPNKGYGPWQALNPYEMWLMVVLIAGISFAGYAAVKIGGERRGILLAGLAGGVAASTAVALSFSRLARDNPDRAPLLAAGIVLASTTMFPRIVLVVAVLQPALVPAIAWPMALAGIAGVAGAALLARNREVAAGATPLTFRNPFEFGMAVKFGVLLVVIMLLARALEVWLGDAGIYLLAVVSGLADVDAVTLSLARLTGPVLSPELAAAGIVIAALTNTAVKAAIAGGIGGMKLGRPVGLALGICILAALGGLAVP